MDYCLYIFGTTVDSPTRRELAEFIEEGAYLSEHAAFEPAPEDAVSAHLEWERLVVQDEGRTFVIERHVDDERLRDEVEKLLFVLPKTQSGRHREWVIGCLGRAHQVFRLCIDAKAASKDEWEMLDNLEALLLKRCDGMLFAPREGFYDAQLQLKHRI